MSFHLHTDIGHDPDDVIALAYLIEHGAVPTSMSILPGYSKQYDIVHRIFKEYNIESPPIYSSKMFNAIITDKEMKYNPGPHKIFIDNDDRVIFNHPIYNIVCGSALIIGPALNLGGKLKCNRMVFQGGYSPNSTNPLEKFKGQKSAQSFNPSGAKKDFEALRDSPDIGKKYYVGKNVCHGWTKVHLSAEWEPSSKLIKQFYDNLSESKAMHDVLAAKMLLEPCMGDWGLEKPVFLAGSLQMSTQSTVYESVEAINSFKTLVGLREEPYHGGLFQQGMGYINYYDDTESCYNKEHSRIE